MIDQAELRRRRLVRLEEELADAGVTLPIGRSARLLAEVDRARFPQRHERKFPSYGAIVCGDGDAGAGVISALDELGAVRLDAPGAVDDVGIGRMADGIRAFALVLPSEQQLVFLASSAAREPELVLLRRALGPDTTLVSRADDGIVRLVEHRQIVIFDGTAWWVKPDAREYAALVGSALPGVAPDLTQQILDFCVHSAGPAPGGTTIVWCLDEDAEARLDQLAAPTEPPLPLPLPLDLPAAHSSIRHLAFQVDGACKVNPSGQVVEVGLHLRATADAHRLVEPPRGRGTRHAAAKRCSFDIPRAAVFVVSEDGPVTVYVGGRTIASIDMAAERPSDRVM